MIIFKLLIAFATALGSTSILAQTDIAFQGIPWGAPESSVIAKFKKDVRRQECTDLVKVLSDRLGHACGALQVLTYDVAGIPFTLTFSFSATDRKLVQVNLLYEGTMQGRAGYEYPQRQWIDQSGALIGSLSERYGPPSRRPSSDGRTIQRAWITESAVIEFQSMLSPGQGPRALGFGSAQERYSITYEPLARRESGKL